ncbi:MAG TPA: helix-turn-helix domain-containing protein [Acidimicrobiia bacterium]|nr:helix-turn-helix domain-containing protein [Acidimicrobiia bacterium]
MDRVDDLDVVATLGEPLRRALYEFVIAASEPVSRDEAAEALDVSRQVAAYHLDRMADDGLLEVEFRRLGGRAGPGAGRPSKLYRRSNETYDVSIPPRRYELAARILLEVARDRGFEEGALAAAAHRAGVEIGENGLDSALSATGYEPAEENGEIRFRNCPFHVLREQDRNATCGLNLALVEGLIEGSGSDVEAVLAPEEGYCCVRLRPKTG